MSTYNVVNAVPGISFRPHPDQIALPRFILLRTESGPIGNRGHFAARRLAMTDQLLECFAAEAAKFLSFTRRHEDGEAADYECRDMLILIRIHYHDGIH